MAKKPVMLCIMDGFGWTPDETYGNAVVAANKPHLDALMKNYPMTTINASGMAVGLPDGQMGNSEVGHTNMGAGRIVYQQLTLITKSIKDGEMFKNPVLVKNMKAAIDAGKGHPPDGPGWYRRRSQPCRSLVRRAGNGQAYGRNQGLSALHHGRP